MTDPVKLYRVTSRRTGPQGASEVTDWLDDGDLAKTVAGDAGVVTAGKWYPDDDGFGQDKRTVRARLGRVHGSWYPDDGDEAARAVAGELRDALVHLLNALEAGDHGAPVSVRLDTLRREADAVLAEARGETER